MPAVSFQSRDAGVAQGDTSKSGPVEAVSDVRRTDARRRKRDRPEGVTQGFHVIVYKVDPRISVLARNLLSKNDWRAALLNEMEPCWP
jgi:hypothetical protein